MLQRACFGWSGVGGWLEDGLDTSYAVAVLQVKGEEGVAGRGGRGPRGRSQVESGEYVGKGPGANVEHTWRTGLPSAQRNPPGLTASGALFGPGLFL